MAGRFELSALRLFDVSMPISRFVRIQPHSQATVYIAVNATMPHCRFVTVVHTHSGWAARPQVKPARRVRARPAVTSTRPPAPKAAIPNCTACSIKPRPPISTF